MSEPIDYSKFPRIDEAILTSLKELSDPGEEAPFLDGLIRLYFMEAPLASRKLEAALSGSDAKAIEHFSHKLKGLSRNLGVCRLSEICATIEHRAAILTAGEGQSLLALSQAELDQVILALRSYLLPHAA